jgi:predicted nucleotide-binding protein
MKTELELFLSNFPDLGGKSRNHTQIVNHFGYFLTEILGRESIEAGEIKKCYDIAGLQSPANISDILRKSLTFIRTTSGFKLRRDIRDEISRGIKNDKSPLPTPPTKALKTTKIEIASPKTSTVFVVHGRDEQIRQSVFSFLRALGLRPLEWEAAVRLTGKGSPYVGEVLDVGLAAAQAVVVIMSPDEDVRLREPLHSEPGDAEWAMQPRPNVYLELGMALAKNKDKTIILQVGEVRSISDIDGRLIVRMNGTPTERNKFAQRLRTAGLDPDTTGGDWLKIGTFKKTDE